METEDITEIERQGIKMALKTLLLRSRLDKLKSDMEALRGKDADFERREAEIEAAISEMNADTSDEDRATVEKQANELETEKAAHEEEKGKLQSEIEKVEGEMTQEEERAKKAVRTPETKQERKADVGQMDTRTKFFGMNLQERDAFFAREDVKKFVDTVRSYVKEKRAIDNIGLIIPDVMLPLIKEVAQQTSKLMSRVDLRRVSGTSRIRIARPTSEAVWTEMCASLNEMSLGFNSVEVDGYKVGIYIAVCNAILEDNDVNLASEIITALGKAIGKATDKAIVYGTDIKMPMGVVTRLAQTVKPSDYLETGRTWVNLSTTNILKGTNKTGIGLFQEIVSAAGVIANDYSENGLIWLMNKKTHSKLVVQSMDKNFNASIVAGINNSMPAIGGDIIELPFIPDDNIVFGYFDNYLLVERAGTQIEQSTHVRFLDDQTVFKGTARYDGVPVIPEAFAVLSLTTTAPVTSVDFAPDVANTPSSEG